MTTIIRLTSITLYAMVFTVAGIFIAAPLLAIAVAAPITAVGTIALLCADHIDHAKGVRFNPAPRSAFKR